MKIIKYFEADHLRQKILKKSGWSVLFNNKLYLGLGEDGNYYCGFDNEVSMRYDSIDPDKQHDIYWYHPMTSVKNYIDVFIMIQIAKHFGKLMVFL